MLLMSEKCLELHELFMLGQTLELQLLGLEEMLAVLRFNLRCPSLAFLRRIESRTRLIKPSPLEGAAGLQLRNGGSLSCIQSMLRSPVDRHLLNEELLSAGSDFKIVRLTSESKARSLTDNF